MNRNFLYLLLAFASTFGLAQAQTAVTADGTGTINNIPRYSGSASLTNSSIADSNGFVTISGPPGMGLRLFDWYGFPENSSTSTLIFAGSDQPNGYASIMSRGSNCCYSDGVLQFSTDYNGVLTPQMLLAPNGNLGIGSGFTNDSWAGSELSIVTANAASETGEHIFNTDSTGYSVLRLGTDNQAAEGGGLHQFNQNWPGDPNGVAPPLGTLLSSFQSGGLILGTWDPSAAIKFFTLANSERMRITPTGLVGIGTSTPSSPLEVNGNVAITRGSNGVLYFADGTYQSTAATSGPTSGSVNFSASSIVAGPSTTGLPSNFTGALTIASPAPDGQGRPSNGILFVDTTSGAAGAWTHAAIYTVGSANWNGSLVFATDGDSQDNFGLAEKMRLDQHGNLGIGTSTPGADLASLASPPSPSTPILEVNGDIALTQGKGGQIIFSDGTVQTTAWNGTTFGGDYAESIDVLGDRAAYEPGDVIVIDESVTGKFGKSAKAYSRMVAGVYSTKPGLVGRRTTADRPDKEAEVPMAMMGIVPTKVSTENGPIERGDLLVSSNTEGYAMKGSDRDRLIGTIIGKALAPLQSGSGVIEVLISLQ